MCKKCGEPLTAENHRKGYCSCRRCYNQQQQEYYQRRKSSGNSIRTPLRAQAVVESLRRRIDKKESAIRQLQVDIELLEEKIEEIERI